MTTQSTTFTGTTKLGTTLRPITAASLRGTIPAGTPVRFAPIGGGRVGLRELGGEQRGAWVSADMVDQAIRDLSSDAAAVMALAGATPRTDPTNTKGTDTMNTSTNTSAVDRIFSLGSLGGITPADQVSAATARPAVTTTTATVTAPRADVRTMPQGRVANGYQNDQGRGRQTATGLDREGGDTYGGEDIVGDCRTVDEMLRAVGLDWTVQSEKFTAAGGADCGDLRAIVRQDTKKVLAVRSKGFAVAQNTDVFAALQPLINAGGRWRAGGSFRDGATVFAQVDLGSYEVIPGDRVQMFAHIRDSRDGAHCWSLQIGSWRIVCANTLMHACEAGEFLAKSRHGRDYAANLDAARAGLEMMRGSALEMVRAYQRLAAWKITPVEVRAMLNDIAPLPTASKTAEDRKARAAAERQHDEIMAMIGGKQRGAYDIDNVLGSGWCALNGVTDYADHILAAARGGAARPITMLRRATEGGPAAMKSAAFDWLTEHVPAGLVVARA